MGQVRNAYTISIGNPKRRGHLEDHIISGSSDPGG